MTLLIILLALLLALLFIVYATVAILVALFIFKAMLVMMCINTLAWILGTAVQTVCPNARAQA